MRQVEPDEPAKIWLASVGKIIRYTMLLRRLEAERLGQSGELVTLLLHARSEFGGPEDRDDLTGITEPLGNDRVLGDFLEVRRNALAQFLRHAAWAEHSANALECQRRVTGFGRGRNVGRARRTLLAGH